MDINKIRFESLGEPERKLLLTALKFDLNKLECYYCKEKVSYKDCCILPPISNPINLHATITCSSPLCVSQYLDDIEDEGKT